MKTMQNQSNIFADIFLQPWFLPMQTASAIRRLIPPEHRHKMRAFFDDYGCLRCSKTAVRYGSNGMCKPCVQEVKLKLLFAIKRRWAESSPLSQPSRTFQRAAEARRLLADLKPGK
jgi:hypothetical protein